MVIYLSDYRMAPETPERNINANTSRFAIACAFGRNGCVKATLEMPEDLSTGEVDGFMDALYALANKI